MSTHSLEKVKENHSKNWLAAPPAIHRLSKAEIDKRYPRYRLSVFMGIFIGYAGFYLIRNNVSVIAALLTQPNGNFTTADIGLIANAVLLAYGFSKFFMAILSDKSNARYFLPIGLVLSALANFAVAFIPWISASLLHF